MRAHTTPREVEDFHERQARFHARDDAMILEECDIPDRNARPRRNELLPVRRAWVVGRRGDEAVLPVLLTLVRADIKSALAMLGHVLMPVLAGQDHPGRSLGPVGRDRLLLAGC